MFYTELTLAAQTAYAQLQDVVMAEHVARTVAQLHGTFARKRIKGREYWYFVFREGSSQRQIYVGPDEPRVRALVKKKRDADPGPIRMLARAYIAQGGTLLLAKHLRLIARLTDFGFFRAGGVLIGTHAFSAFANLLGVKWMGGDRTMDVDLGVPGRNVSIALPGAPPANLHDALSTFEAGFLPTHTFAGNAGPTYSLRGEPDLQVDFLTTLHRGGEAPRKIETLAVTAQPLKFIDYLLEEPTQCVLLDRTGHCVVATVPEPARYAVHKLIVYGERPSRQRTKARKDLEQAAALFQWFAAHDAPKLRQAWDQAFARGTRWRSRLRMGLAALEALLPVNEIGLTLVKPAKGTRRARR